MITELENVIFSEGQFNKNEHGVEFVDLINNEASGEYVTLVSQEFWDGKYLELFAQVHFIVRTEIGFLAMRVPLVESFSDFLEVDDGATERGEVYHLKQELFQDTSLLDDYRERFGIRAELNNPFNLEDDPWDDFRRWLNAPRS